MCLLRPAFRQECRQWSRVSDGAEQRLVLPLLEAQPVVGRDSFGPLRLGLEPALDRPAQLLLGAHSLGERHVREGAVEPGEQLAQRAQALQLPRSEDAVAGLGAPGLDQAGALYV